MSAQRATRPRSGCVRMSWKQVSSSLLLISCVAVTWCRATNRILFKTLTQLELVSTLLSFSATEHQPYVPATVQDVHAHMAEAQLARHPEEGWGLSKDAPPSPQAAVRQVAAWGRTTPAKRDERMRALQAMQLKLQPLTDQARQAVSPEHLQDPLAPKPHIAWLAAISLAYSLDERICFDAALGVLAVGDIPPSGAFPPLIESRCAKEEAKGDFEPFAASRARRRNL